MRGRQEIQRELFQKILFQSVSGKSGINTRYESQHNFNDDDVDDDGLR